MLSSARNLQPRSQQRKHRRLLSHFLSRLSNLGTRLENGQTRVPNSSLCCATSSVMMCCRTSVCASKIAPRANPPSGSMRIVRCFSRNARPRSLTSIRRRKRSDCAKRKKSRRSRHLLRSGLRSSALPSSASLMTLAYPLTTPRAKS